MGLLKCSKYNSTFVPAKAMKAQILTDFIGELTPNNSEDDLRKWKVFVDGSSVKNGCGARIILINPDGVKAEYAIHFPFPSTNNMAEYETFLVRFRIIKKFGISKAEIFLDSKLTYNQIFGNYEMKDANLVSYAMKEFFEI